MKKGYSFSLKQSNMEKLKFIAQENERNVSGQLELLIKEHIENYEKIKGKIIIPEDNEE